MDWCDQLAEVYKQQIRLEVYVKAGQNSLTMLLIANQQDVSKYDANHAD